MNPIRRGTNLNSFDWKKTENTFYDGEDVMVYEGKGNLESLKLKSITTDNIIYEIQK